jgi:hypothetical protein
MPTHPVEVVQPARRSRLLSREVKDGLRIEYWGRHAWRIEHRRLLLDAARIGYHRQCMFHAIEKHDVAEIDEERTPGQSTPARWRRVRG